MAEFVYFVFFHYLKKVTLVKTTFKMAMPDTAHLYSTCLIETEHPIKRLRKTWIVTSQVLQWAFQSGWVRSGATFTSTFSIKGCVYVCSCKTEDIYLARSCSVWSNIGYIVVPTSNNCVNLVRFYITCQISTRNALRQHKLG